jgi:hypothetical protein
MVIAAKCLVLTVGSTLKKAEDQGEENLAETLN